MHRVFGEMYNLKTIAGILMRLPLRDGGRRRAGEPRWAGPPFEMPYSLRLPAADADCWRLHQDLLASAGHLGDRLLPAATPDGERYLRTLRQLDAESLRVAGDDPRGRRGPGKGRRMTIRALRILPPLAIGRLGSAPEPLDNYTVEVDPARPLGYRQIRGAETLVVDKATGEIRESRVPAKVEFTRDGRIRPVAPFLEVFAETDAGVLEPLTLELLRREGLTPAALEWTSWSPTARWCAARAMPPISSPPTPGGSPATRAASSRGTARTSSRRDRFVSFGHVRYIMPERSLSRDPPAVHAGDRV